MNMHNTYIPFFGLATNTLNVRNNDFSLKQQCNENADHKQDWQSYPVDQSGKIANPARVVS